MEPLTFRDYIGVALCYLIFLMPIHLTVGVVGTLVSIILLFIRRTWFKIALKAFWLFTALLLCSGFMLNIVWNIAVFDNLYWAYDYAGWECSPFGLTLCGIAESPVRYYHGMTEGSIRGVWLIYAALSWGSAIWATYRIIKRKSVEQALQAALHKGSESLSRNGGNEVMNGKRTALICIAAVVAVVGALIAYSAMQVECPYCHNADGNGKGNCVLRQRTGACSEDYYGQHHNKSNCPWCESRGHMTRAEAWMD